MQFDSPQNPRGKSYSKETTSLSCDNLMLSVVSGTAVSVEATAVTPAPVLNDSRLIRTNIEEYSLLSARSAGSAHRRFNLAMMDDLGLDDVDILDDVKEKLRVLCRAFKRNGFDKKRTEMMVLVNLGMKEVEEEDIIN